MDYIFALAFKVDVTCMPLGHQLTQFEFSYIIYLCKSNFTVEKGILPFKKEFYLLKRNLLLGKEFYSHKMNIISLYTKK